MKLCLLCIFKSSFNPNKYVKYGTYYFGYSGYASTKRRN